MKLFECTRDELLRPLQTVTGIVERRHTLPILSNVLIEAGDAGLSFLATDLEIQITSRAPDIAAASSYQVTASARKLQDILRALPEDARLSLEASANRLMVKTGKSRFSLQTLPAEDFPRLADTREEPLRFAISQKALRGLLQKVHFAMAQQDIRYYLNGLLLVAGADELRLVATDGHRLAFVRSALALSAERREVVLPRKVVLELLKLLADSEDEVQVELLPAQVRFRFGASVLTTKTVDGKFPDYTRVIPTNYQRRFTIARTTLMQALQRAAILSNEKFRGVRWVLTEGSLRVSCSNTEQEEANEELEVDYRGDALDIGFNVNYLLDVLSALSGESINCWFGDASSSVLVTEPDNDDYRYVIMPMRI